MKKFLPIIALVFLVEAPRARPQGPGVPVKLIVTAEPKHGSETPLIKASDVTAYENHKPVTVSSWVPARDSNAALELFFLIDDASDVSQLGSQLGDIRQFVASQAPATLTGVAYMQDGIAQIVQNLTSDHSAAAKTVRLPLGMITAGGSPYLSLSDLIKRWPAGRARREVVMISSGIDPLGGPPPIDPYLETAIDDAQRAGIVVYTVYEPYIGHFGHSFYRIYWGQNYLSELSEDTGADMFGFGNIPPVSLVPFFKEISNRLANQYIATLLLRPRSKAGFEPVRMITKTPNGDLLTQTRAYVPLGG